MSTAASIFTLTKSLFIYFYHLDNYLLSKRKVIQLSLPDSPISTALELGEHKKEGDSTVRHIEDSEEIGRAHV